MRPSDRPPPRRPRRQRPDPADRASATGAAVATPPAASVDPLLGKTVGRCVIAARIGVGRTSVVYRARHTGIDGDVAVKILLPEAVAQPTLVERFEQEARAIARIDHENILKIYDVFREGDLHGIVMELLEGETVLELIEREERLPPLDAMRIVKQSALGLGAAHAKGIVHRDVKPQNLVLLPDGIVKVVDFGLAEEVQPATAGSRIGTPHYMAPEIWEARPAEDRSDVYALGITLYHLLVGRPPYAGRSLKEILAGHVEGKPLHPERAVSSLPKALCELVRDMTKRDPISRIPMTEVVERIDGIGGEEIKTPAGVRLRRGARRRRALAMGRGGGVPAWALAISGAAILGVAVALFMGSKAGDGSGDDAPPPPGTASVPAPPVPDAPPSAPPPPPVDPAVERRRAEEAAKTAAEQESRAEGDRALKAAEGHARESWEDKRSVVLRYRSVADRFPKTAAGDEARRRADGIARGTLHAHPDRQVVPKEVLEAAAKAWEEARAAFEAAIAQKRYAIAATTVPAGLEDAEGPVAKDIAFHRALASDLGDFLRALQREGSALPEPRRTIVLDGRERRVQDVGAEGLLVAGDRGQEKLTWAAAPPEAVVGLAERAFEGKGGRESMLVVAFAYAHRLEDAFYVALLQARAGTPSKAESARLDAYEARAAARFAK